jgi:hypothetical protein
MNSILQVLQVFDHAEVNNMPFLIHLLMPQCGMPESSVEEPQGNMQNSQIGGIE